MRLHSLARYSRLDLHTAWIRKPDLDASFIARAVK
jgi:hypothetical protein